MEKFFNEQLTKLLPDYFQKRSIDLNGDGKAIDAKRIRLTEPVTTEIIDDDDVILTA